MIRPPCVNPPSTESDRAVATLRSGARWICSGLACLLVWACSAPPSKPSSPVQTQLQVQNQNGARAWRRGDLAAALAAYSDALTAAESVEDFDAAGAALLNLAAVQGRLGQADAAQTRLDRIVNAPQHYGALLQGQAAARKALLYVDQADHASALRWAERAELNCPEPCMLAPAMGNLRAGVAFQSGESRRAADLAVRAAELATRAGLSAEQANGLRLAGRAETRLGNTSQAATWLALALQIDRDLGLPERIALDLQSSGENEERRGQAAAARDFYERALVVVQASGDSPAAQVLRARLAALAPAPRQ